LILPSKAQAEISMLALNKIRTLDIEPTVATRPKYVYAASGLARIAETLYIVADDELQLAVFNSNDMKPGSWIRLLPGTLPDDYDERKKAKPDLESITHVQPYEFAPHGALLVVPSMSKKTRINGLVLALDSNGVPEGQPLPIDFTVVREKLKTLVRELNIEGIVVGKKTVKLLHRGSKNKSKSAVIELDASRFLKDLHDSHTIGDDYVQDTTEYGDLGGIDDIPFQFTDAVALPDERILFLVTAENTENSFDDGASAGSAVGILGKNGKVEKVVRFDSKEKLEGVSARVNANSIELLMVSDTDDQTKPAGLFAARLEG